MMKSPHDVALGFRDQLARTAKKVQARRPLRILVKREVPLMRETQQLGHLELLLRLSFRGEGQGTGVLVFEWPDSAKDHSVVRMLQGWSDRCGQAGTCQDGVLELERKRVTLPGIHFKVEFPVTKVPGELLELFELAARTGLVTAARAEMERPQEPTAEEVTAEKVTAEGPTTNGPTTNGPAEAPHDHARSTAANNGQDQAKVDAITHNAVFDPKVHPHVNPNQEVCTSKGVTFRLVMKRMGGRPTRVWVHVNGGTNSPARTQHLRAGH
ncbi:MAG: hypothetical protein ACYST0_01305 [Planctomycetota bacterium]|jgi:hypothetical protein